MEKLPQAPLEVPPIPNPEKQQQDEVRAHFVDTAKLAFHGIVANLATKLEDRAARRMERMEHKDALYADIGHLALHGTSESFKPSATPTGEPARPRTWVERLRDKRLDKKAQALEDKRREALFLEGVYKGIRPPSGTEQKERRKTHRQEIKQVKSDYKAGIITAEQLRVARTALKSTSESIGDLYDKYKTGELSEADFKKAVEKTKSTVRERPTQRKARKKYERARRKLEKKVTSMSTSRWRTMRRNRAIGHIKRYHARAERARDSGAKLRKHPGELD